METDPISQSVHLKLLPVSLLRTENCYPSAGTSVNSSLILWKASFCSIYGVDLCQNHLKADKKLWLSI